MNGLIRYASTMAILVAVCSPAAAQNITNVVETGGDNEATDTIPAKWTGQTFNVTVANEPVPGAAIGQPYTVGLFGHQAPAFVDRVHRYSDHFTGSTPPDFKIPAYLVGGEYIMSGNDNRDNANYRLDVTVASPSTVYMLIDNRLSDGSNANPPTFGPANMQWILDQNWMATNNGLNRTGDTAVPDEVPFDEAADDDIDQWFSVYKKDFPAGTFSLLQPNNADRNMYGVVILSSGPPPVPGDTDGDGIVELEDFNPIRANFRKAVSSRSQGDLVNNGRVDFEDFEQWKVAFTGGGGSIAGLDLANVPEPGGFILAALGLVCFHRARPTRCARQR